MKFDIICADPPWSFSDKLEMSDIKRGAAAQYQVMTNHDILNLQVLEIAADNAMLALWVPSSLLSLGLQVMEAWGFRQTQTLPWIKVKKEPLQALTKQLVKRFASSPVTVTELEKVIATFDLTDILSFGMGRLFRQTHELLLIGVRGKIYDKLSNRSQRSVIFGPNTKHSSKPDELQKRLEMMFPTGLKLEMFARRDRPNWTCVGLQCPSTLEEQITASLARLAKL